MISAEAKLDIFKKDIDAIVIRHYIEENTKEYDNSKTYVIYDGKEIEIFDRELFNLKKKNKYFKNYLISEPVEFY